MELDGRTIQHDIEDSRRREVLFHIFERMGRKVRKNYYFMIRKHLK